MPRKMRTRKVGNEERRVSARMARDVRKAEGREEMGHIRMERLPENVETWRFEYVLRSLMDAEHDLETLRQVREREYERAENLTGPAESEPENLTPKPVQDDGGVGEFPQDLLQREQSMRKRLGVKRRSWRED